VIYLNQEEDTSKKSSTVQKRQVACIVSINTLIQGKYIRQDGWQPNYILTKDNNEISRVNLMGVIIDISLDNKSFLVDDGTGNIQVRAFEEIKQLKDIQMGDIVNIIGKPREFNDDKYIIPEIVKKVEDKRWVDVWKKRLSIKELKKTKSVNLQDKEKGKLNQNTNKTSQKITKKETPNNHQPVEKTQSVFDLIKKLDKGEGADFDEVVESYGLTDGEDIIKNLLKEGEIFEIKSGRLKVLE